MIGQVFGRLTVVALDEGRARRYYHCACACGRSHLVRADHLRSGRISSCGCWHDEAAAVFNETHGERRARTPEYRAWCNMIDRCERQACPSFAHYGGRGITVCSRWRASFVAFLEDMGRRPSPQHSLDRIDVNGQYSPGNCRWADRKTQARNVRNVKHITAFGKALTLAEWADETGIDKRKIFMRLRGLGWTPERALSQR